MIKVATILLGLISVQIGIGQTGTIKGHLQDTILNEGLDLAQIVLYPHTGTMSDVDGYFIIEDVPVGSYDLKISCLGYQDTVLSSIWIGSDTTINLFIAYPLACQYDQKNKICPVCYKEDKVIPIIYGLATGTLVKSAKKGKVRLGGCVITGCDPHWYCKRDKREF